MNDQVIKINISNNPRAQEALKTLLEEKQQRQDEFRRAVQDGKLDEYAKKHRFAQPVSVPKP